jgi:site-specific recombinase XerD
MQPPLCPRFEQFIRERQILHSVTPATVEWYRRCLKWLPAESPTQADLKDVMMRLRERNLTEAGCNTVTRCINAYLHWACGAERKCGAGCTHPRIAKLREPQQVMPTFSEAQVKKLLAWKPKSNGDRRLHLVVLTMLDTGCRVSEALTLRVADVDLDNLLLRLDGKGRKQRLVPISGELRKALYRHIAEHQLEPSSLVFATRNGTQWSRRNVLRGVKRVCRGMGFNPPARTVHAFRHTFAVNYLRRGGSVFHLQKTLGHTTLEMSRRYSNLDTSDLQAAHQRISLLSK